MKVKSTCTAIIEIEIHGNDQLSKDASYVPNAHLHMDPLPAQEHAI